MFPGIKLAAGTAKMLDYKCSFTAGKQQKSLAFNDHCRSKTADILIK
jgi:hypothetical protein